MSLEVDMHSRKQIDRQGGYSMVELLIAMVIMIIVTGVAFALIHSSLKFTSSTFHMTDAEQSLRTANELISRDLTTSGDGLKGLGSMKMPPLFAQNYLTRSPVLCEDASGYVCMAIVMSDDGVPGTTAVPQTNPAVTVLGGTDRLTLMAQDTSFAPVSLVGGKITFAGTSTTIVVPDATKFRAGEIYAISADQNAAFGVISIVNNATKKLTLTNGDIYNINQTGANTPINVVSIGGTVPTSIMRMQIIHYFVNSNGLLIRRVFGVAGGPFIDSVIAEHVTNLKFRFLTSVPDATGFVPQPSRALGTSEAQNKVREVETTITVETVKASNSTNSNNNGRQKISTTTITSVRNLQFRQALL